MSVKLTLDNPTHYRDDDLRRFIQQALAHEAVAHQSYVVGIYYTRRGSCRPLLSRASRTQPVFRLGLPRWAFDVSVRPARKLLVPELSPREVETLAVYTAVAIRITSGVRPADVPEDVAVSWATGLRIRAQEGALGRGEAGR